MNDWAQKAADQIARANYNAYPREAREEIASIIRRHAAPLLELIKLRDHAATYLDEANDHEPCPRHYDDGLESVCTCGADEWNAKVDAVAAKVDSQKTWGFA